MIATIYVAVVLFACVLIVENCVLLINCATVTLRQISFVEGVLGALRRLLDSKRSDDDATNTAMGHWSAAHRIFSTTDFGNRLAGGVIAASFIGAVIYSAVVVTSPLLANQDDQESGSVGPAGTGSRGAVLSDLEIFGSSLARSMITLPVLAAYATVLGVLALRALYVLVRVLQWVASGTVRSCRRDLQGEQSLGAYRIFVTTCRFLAWVLYAALLWPYVTVGAASLAVAGAALKQAIHWCHGSARTPRPPSDVSIGVTLSRPLLSPADSDGEIMHVSVDTDQKPSEAIAHAWDCHDACTGCRTTAFAQTMIDWIPLPTWKGPPRFCKGHVETMAAAIHANVLFGAPTLAGGEWEPLYASLRNLSVPYVFLWFLASLGTSSVAPWLRAGLGIVGCAGAAVLAWRWLTDPRSSQHAELIRVSEGLATPSFSLCGRRRASNADTWRLVFAQAGMAWGRQCQTIRQHAISVSVLVWARRCRLRTRGHSWSW